jgi:hypothetical protein
VKRHARVPLVEESDRRRDGRRRAHPGLADLLEKRQADAEIPLPSTGILNLGPMGAPGRHRLALETTAPPSVRIPRSEMGKRREGPHGFTAKDRRCSGLDHRLCVGRLPPGERHPRLGRLGNIRLSTVPVRWQSWSTTAFADMMVVARCAYCDFNTSAPVEEARTAFQTHECDRPKPGTTVRRRSGFGMRATRLPGSS